MSEEKINQVYDDFEVIVSSNFYKYAFSLIGASLIVLGIRWGNINPSTFIPLLTAVPISLTLCASNINANIRKYKKKHKGFKFSTNAFKLDSNRKKALKLAKKKYKNEYIEKCEVVKREVTNPINADLYYPTLDKNKVKVKVKTK